MKKTSKLPKVKKTPGIIPIDPVPSFHRISQIMLSGQIIALFPKPVFCTQDVGLKLGLGKCTLEGDLITIQVKSLDPEEQKLMFLESNEIELTKYVKE